MNFTFFGGANEVGASCTLIEIDKKRILVDAGIRPNGKPDEQLPDLEALWEAGLPHAVLLTHAHTDHTGALPDLEKMLRQDVKVYCTAPTKDITRKLLNDAARRRDDDYIEHVRSALHRMQCVNFNQRKDICEGVTATWIPAGHILGAAMIHIQGQKESVLMTGDVSVANQLTIPGMDSPPLNPDVMVMESTYGDRLHKSRSKESTKLIKAVANTIEKGGKVLLPVFAVGRSQEVILILKNAMERGDIRKVRVYVDGMVGDVNNVYANHGESLSDRLRRRLKRDEDIFYSDNIMKVPRHFNRHSILSGPPCCIVASSGMLVGGRSVWYTKHFAGNPANLIGLTGYQAEGNPGRELEGLIGEKDLEKRVVSLPDDEKKDCETENRVAVKVLCKVSKYPLSAHADRNQLTSLAEKVRPRLKVFLVHGNLGAREELAASVHERLPAVELVLPENGSSHTVEKHAGIANGRSLNHSRILIEVSTFLRKMGFKGPFSDRELTEIWFGTEATTPTTVDFFRWCLWLDSRFFKRRSDGLFYPWQPV